MRLNIRKKNNYSYYSIIKDYTNLNGKRTTKIFEKLGNQAQVEERFGKEDTLNEIKKYIDSLNNESKEEIIKKEFNPNKKIPLGLKRQFNVGYLFLQKLYNELHINNICQEIQNKYQFHFDLNEIFSYLVFARIIYPSSKLETFKQCQNFIEQPKFQLHDEYRSLNYIANNIDLIQEKLFNNSLNVINRDSKVIYYDCTNYFFEITNEDDIKKYGISKQHQPKPLIGMGLFMDGNGLPLAFNIYPGNKNEQETLIPTENKIINNFKLKDTKIILCTDAGLASDKIKNFNIKDGRAFVITQSLKKIKKEYKELALDENDWRIINDLKKVYNIKSIMEDEELKEKYFETIFYKIIPSETKSVKQDLIVTFSPKYFEDQRNIRNEQIERAKKSIDNKETIRKGKNQNDYRRFIETISTTKEGEIAENIAHSLNEALIKEEEIYDGYYALTTNLIGDVEKILNIVKGRWEIEESFRIMKNDFLARPVNLSREDRIKAHFTICFVSLFIYRLLENKLNYKYTTSQILNTLRNMNIIEHKGCGYEPIYERTQLTDDIHDYFKFNTDFEILSYKKMKKILNNKN